MDDYRLVPLSSLRTRTGTTMFSGAETRTQATANQKLGSRVFVRKDPEFGPGPWPAEPTGTIAGDLDGETWATVDMRQGPERMRAFSDRSRDSGSTVAMRRF